MSAVMPHTQRSGCVPEEESVSQKCAERCHYTIVYMELCSQQCHFFCMSGFQLVIALIIIITRSNCICN